MAIPKIVYRGTLSKSRTPSSHTMRVIFTTPNKRTAEIYAEVMAYEEDRGKAFVHEYAVHPEAVIADLNLGADVPEIVNRMERRIIESATERRHVLFRQSEDPTVRFINILKSMGYDGYYYERQYQRGGPDKELVVFDPSALIHQASYEKTWLGDWRGRWGTWKPCRG